MAVKPTSILFLFYSIAADIIILNRVKIKTLYVSFENNDADQPMHLYSLNSAFSLAASILLKHGPISQITILLKQGSLSLDQSHNS